MSGCVVWPLRLKVRAAKRASSAVLMAVRPNTPMKMPSTTSSVRPLRRVTSASDLRRLALKSLMPVPPCWKDDRADSMLPDGADVPLTPRRQHILPPSPQVLAGAHHASADGLIDASQQAEKGGCAAVRRLVDGKEVVHRHRAGEALQDDGSLGAGGEDPTDTLDLDQTSAGVMSGRRAFGFGFRHTSSPAA